MSLDFELYNRIDFGGEYLEVGIVSFNITHNLGAMARACGLYEPLWRPEEHFPSPNIACDLIEPVRVGRDRLVSDPNHYLTFNPSNGWGKYGDLVDFSTNVLESLELYPSAWVRAWR